MWKLGSEKKTFCGRNIESFVNFKIKQIIALEDLAETITQSEFTAAVQNLELNGSGFSLSEFLVSWLIFIKTKKKVDVVTLMF